MESIEGIRDKIEKGGTAMLRQADLGNGTYQNPVLYGDYSDPDAIRVGDDYYMIASSFSNAPAIPILHSYDLVNWKVVNYVCRHVPEFRYINPIHGSGVWAPAIRYHDGEYYVFFPMPDEGIYRSKAKDPKGEWSKPVNMMPEYGVIDPCPFWDDDGKAYLITGVAGSRKGYKSVLRMAEMAPDGTCLLSESKIIYDGRGTENDTIEGPKVYKKDGWYYIFAPAGGVKCGFQVALRSRDINGPYEYKIVMRQGDSPVNGPHQGAWVHNKYGEDWFLHFQDKEAYGRVVHLNPVDWSSGWPVMGKKGEPVLTYKKPQSSSATIVNPVESDEFNIPAMGLQWQWHANYDEKFGVPTAFGTFRIYTYKLSENWKNFWEVPNLLLQKTPADAFTVTTKLRFTSKAEGQMGGIIMMGLDYSALVVRRVGQEFQLVQMTCKQADKGKAQSEQVLATLKPTATDKIDYKPGIHEDIYLRLTVSDSKMTFAYSQNGKKFNACGDEFKMREGKWIGAKFGYIAVETDQKADRGWVDADWIRVTSVSK